MPDDRPTVYGPHRPKPLPVWTKLVWLVPPLLGLSLLPGWAPSWLRETSALVLWATGGMAFLALLAVFAVPASGLVDKRPLWTRKPSQPRLTNWLRRATSIFSLIVLPLLAGHPYLAGCFAAVFVMAAGVPTGTREMAVHDERCERPISRSIYRCLVTALGPVMWCFLWWVPMRQRRLARRLRDALGIPRSGVYFLHSEQHQYDHFLDPEGVLWDARDRVVVRNWRRDVLRSNAEGGPPSPPGQAEHDMLARYGISNLREDLPFVLVLAPDDRLSGVRLSKSYRMRRRDRGEALRRELVYGAEPRPGG